MAGEDWSDEQNDAIVADYFAMLVSDVTGRPYSKAEHNRALQALIGRGKGSIEFKHQNISAVLKGLGEDWIPGYKPAFNFQGALVDAVARWLARNQAWLAPESRQAVSPKAVKEGSALWIGPPPTHSNAPPPSELEQMTAIATKFDVAARDERNRALGKAGEARVVAHERASLTDAGRSDLARRVRWVADEDGDGAGFDIASFEFDGRARLIEVKTPHEANQAYGLDLSIVPPKVGATFPVLVPQVNADGNERDGVQLPEITVPLATYVGWNMRDPSIGAPDQRVAFEASYLPFPKTAAERLQTHDPRPSIAERYRDPRRLSRTRYGKALDDLVRQTLDSAGRPRHPVATAAKRNGRRARGELL